MSRVRYRCLAGGSVLLLAVAAASAAPPAKGGTADVAAIIDGKVITLQQVDKQALKTNMKLAQSLYDARKTALDEIILQRSFAAKASAAGMTVEQFIQKRMAEKAAPITSADIETFYNANKGRLRGRTLEQATGQIRNYLANQRKTTAKSSLLAEAKKNAKVVYKLDAPRVELVVAASEPSRGPTDAKVTIVEFSDFQ